MRFEIIYKFKKIFLRVLVLFRDKGSHFKRNLDRNLNTHVLLPKLGLRVCGREHENSKRNEL